jgi:hypothetical protein
LRSRKTAAAKDNGDGKSPISQAEWFHQHRRLSASFKRKRIPPPLVSALVLSDLAPFWTARRTFSASLWL